MHLYRIAQEAVNNAIKHARPTRIDITLAKTAGGIELSVADNGMGLPEGAENRDGMGLRIMNYRANMIGGTLEIGRGREGGTLVLCHLPPRIRRNGDWS